MSNHAKRYRKCLDHRRTIEIESENLEARVYCPQGFTERELRRVLSPSLYRTLVSDMAEQHYLFVGEHLMTPEGDPLVLLIASDDGLQLLPRGAVIELLEEGVDLLEGMQPGGMLRVSEE